MHDVEIYKRKTGCEDGVMPICHKNRTLEKSSHYRIRRVEFLVLRNLIGRRLRSKFHLVVSVSQSVRLQGNV